MRRRDDQGDDRQSGNDEVEGRSPATEPGDGHVTVEVAEQQDGLEEEEDRRPHGRRPAEDRQDEAADERFHAEQQERGQPDRQRERQRRTEDRARDSQRAGRHEASGRWTTVIVGDCCRGCK